MLSNLATILMTVGGTFGFLFGLGMMTLAASDPEGRGSYYVLWGLIIALVGAVVGGFAVINAIWQLFR